jgi:hypothetical protein
MSFAQTPIDIYAYIQKARDLGRDGLARKTKTVDVREAKPDEIVVTVIKGEGKEKQSPPAKAGDMYDGGTSWCSLCWSCNVEALIREENASWRAARAPSRLAAAELDHQKSEPLNRPDALQRTGSLGRARRSLSGAVSGSTRFS